MKSTRTIQFVLFVLSFLFTSATAHAALVAPGSPAAQAMSSSQVSVSWLDTNTGETGYSVERSLNATSGFAVIGTTGKNGKSYQSTGLTSGTMYHYRVRATGRKGTASPYSAVVSATTTQTVDTTAPSVPTGLTASAGSCSQINLSWAASTDSGGSGLKGYNVYRNGTFLKQVTTTSTSDTGLAASTNYSYTVSAVDNANNQSAQSSAAGATTPACPDTAAPSVPTGLTASAGSCSQINLSWTASTDTGGSGLKGYNVYRNGAFLKQVTTTSTSDTGLNASTAYSYTVSAVDNADNQSAQSAADSATTPVCPDTTAPSVPSGVTASAGSCNQINLSWAASTDSGGSGLKGYNVYRNGAFLKQVATTSTTDTGLTASTTYSYTVSAVDNANNQSAQSAADSATTPACPDTTAPSVPAGLTASAGSCSQVNLSWTASTDNTGGSGMKGYNVYRNGTFLKQVTTTSTSDTGLNASTAYSYTVLAVDNANNQSGQSNTAMVNTPACLDTTAPSVPTGLTASASSCSQVNLSWTASTDNTGGSGMKGYNIYRNGSPTPLNSQPIATTSYTDSNLQASTPYSYAVAAVDNANNQSAQSTAASATTPSCTGSSVDSWDAAFGDTGNDRSQSVAVDGSGNVAAAGFFKGTVDFGGGPLISNHYPWLDPLNYQDGFVVKYSATGAHLWSRAIGGVADDTATAVAVDGSGNVVVTGAVQSDVDFGNGVLTPTRGSYDVFVVKYASVTGSHLWSKRFSGTGNEFGNSVAVDGSSDEVVVTGVFEGTVDFGGGSLSSAGGNDIFMAKYSAAGNHLWSKRIGSVADEKASAVTVDDGGNVIVTGNFMGTVNFGGGSLSSVGGRDIFVVKYSSAGVHLWSERFGGSGDDIANAVTVDGSGNVAVTGYFSGTANFGGGSLSSAGGTDIFVAKYSAAGNHLWSKRFGSTSSDYGYGVTVDGSGNVSVTGAYMGTVDFGGGALTSVGLDAFVAQYTGAGSHLWSQRFGGTLYQFGTDIAAEGSGEVAVTGYFLDVIDFGNGPLTSVGDNDIFLVKFTP